MKPLPFEQARRCVLETVVRSHLPTIETVSLSNARGRILARSVTADREYPPLPRSTRDGFAVRSADIPGTLQIVSEVRAGQRFTGTLRAGEAIEIMTGAPVPEGADAIVMVEHSTIGGQKVTINRTATAGENIVPVGSECRSGTAVLEAGTRLDFGHIAAAATVGAAALPVFASPVVSILATGDELVAVEQSPAPHQIRNSNAHALAAQVERAGGTARVLPVSPDEYNALRTLIAHGLESDLLLLSGGVSAGKYDLVEQVLAGLGAEFFFDRVLIQPGQPLVFGRARGKYFFGLPGNPASTMVTFEIFARAALELLGGRNEAPLPFVFAELEAPFKHRPGLTRFLPAQLNPNGRTVCPLKWQGSGDVFALARANSFLVARDERESWKEGDVIEVLLR